ncbi:hypothetical protein HanXRQr2_Chr05g0233971 [Helianthus annuus]|uniref:Uncharacterized protein n=1 Tax=Helianthus annuus TaxID=4232 RepID=A0A9K3J2A1_HELAN|nr:hypothetical protein HanXRQr2_Chr05g0233971 [Helianthus annuus]
MLYHSIHIQGSDFSRCISFGCFVRTFTCKQQTTVALLCKSSLESQG